MTRERTTILTASERETGEAGRALAARLGPDMVVLLSGELGAGKTAFVRGLAEGLGIDPGEVTSPTFTLVQEYRGGRLPLYHVDLYRLQSNEVDDLGLDELGRGAVLAIEWPDRLPRRLPQLSGAPEAPLVPMVPMEIDVRIEHRDERHRAIEIDGYSDR